jgi:mgtE-like transporter
MRGARRTHRVWDLWRSERTTLRQAFLALLISSGGDLLAGLALGSMTHTLDRLPGLLILVPAAIGMRGDVLGALGSRLGTSIHAGMFGSGIRDRGGVAFQNVVAAAMLSMSTALYLGILARGVSVLFGLPSISVVDLVAISILGGVIGSALVGGATIGLAGLANRRGWDLDAVSAPLVTAAGDVVTLPALWLASFVAQIRYVTVGLASALTLMSLITLVRGFTTPNTVTRRIVRESLPVLAVAGMLHLAAGAILETHLEAFIVFPALLVLVPSFLEDTGALGGILSARLASKLHLGVIPASLRPQPPAVVDIAINFALATSVFTFLGASGWLVARVIGLEGPGLPTMLGVSLVAGFIATVLSSAVAYLAAVATYRFGLDPDNHGIPIVTSVMDFLGAGTFVVALVLFGLAG